MALELPDQQRAAFAAWAAGLEVDGLRVLPETSLHVTLAFLGWRPPGDLPAIASVLEEVVSGPIEPVTVTEAVWLPKRRPGVLALRLGGTGEPAIRALQAAVSAALAALDVYRPEQRPFLPHVTVGRVKTGARVPAAARDLSAPAIAPCAPPAVTLFRSLLSPRGARYEPLARVGL